MTEYSLSHIPGPVLLRDLERSVAGDRASLAVRLAQIAEVDARRLHAEAGYPSVFAYCVQRLRYSEDEAGKRIHAARTAREFPEIFTMVADGRLHLTGIQMLAPRLTRANARDLLAAASHRTKAGIQLLLAERFPQPDLPSRVVELASPEQERETEHAPEHVHRRAEGASPTTGVGASPATVVRDPTSPDVAASTEAANAGLASRLPEPANGGATQTIGPSGSRPAEPPTRATVTPLAPRRFGMQFTVDESTHELYRYAQSLLGPRVPPGDVAAVFGLALEALVRNLEKRKFAATPRPHRRSARTGTNARHIPAAVKRAVWRRDGGRCTFVSDLGGRCESRENLQFDHIQPVARGGETVTRNLRLLCGTHNQLAAERLFGAGFMKERRRRTPRGAAPVPAREPGQDEPPAVAEERRRLAAEARARVETWIRPPG